MKKDSKIDPAITTAILSLILLKLAQPLDAYLSGSLCSLIDPGSGLQGESLSNAGKTADLGLFLVYAAGGFICARYLRSRARLIVIPQLLLLTIAIVLLFHQYLLPKLHPLSYLAAGLLGYAAGLLKLRNIAATELAHTQELESSLLHRRLLETRLQLIKQDEVERKILAADLHDQVLNDMKLQLKLLEQKKDEISEPLLNELCSNIEVAMESVRKVMESLCPSDLEHIGLLAALEDCLKNMSERGNFLPQFRSTIDEERIHSLNKIEKALLYRLVQESITNICKHAKATRVRLSVDLSDRELMIRVVDNGIGLKESETNTKSRGLQYMKLRAEIVGARISWSPGPENKGTAVEIRLNLPEN